MPAPTQTAPTLRCALDRARAAWLAGHAGAWERYCACLRQLEQKTARPRGSRRSLRPGARA
ncbi:hypothetical protein [Rubrivirga marina]|uniref:hypothetical protein n=1 Tax=Rubrivirga marina TaxID=1196024 RepID=UPI00117B5103|nr:hypothetical protein [Rubrivirga marina]